MLATWLTWILLVSPTPIAAGGSGALMVDCDAGDRLEDALQRVEMAGDGRIRVSGTCRGHYAFSGGSLRLEAATAGATLQARTEGIPVLHIRGGDSVVLRGLRFVDGEIGARVAGVDSLSVIDSEFKGNQIGLYLEKGTDVFVSNTRIVKNGEGGLAMRTGANGSVVDSEIADNGRIGVSLLQGARVALVDSVVTGHEEIGLDVWIQCSANLWRVEFADNGGVHIAARDRSRIHVVSETTLGSAGDETDLGAYLAEQSSLTAFSATEIFGDIVSQDAAYVDLGGIEVHGSFFVSDFGRVNLRQTDVDGMIHCDTGGDAICTQTGTLLTEGCPSAPPDCQFPRIEPGTGRDDSRFELPRLPGRFRVEREAATAGKGALDEAGSAVGVERDR